MRITKAMIVAAQRAEFDVNQRMRTLDADRFVPSPPEVIRAMPEAALGAAQTPGSQMKAAQEARPRATDEKRRRPVIVTAPKPKSRR